MIETLLIILASITSFFVLIAGILTTDEAYNMSDPVTATINKITLGLSVVSIICFSTVEMYSPGFYQRDPLNNLTAEREDLVRRLTAIDTRISRHRSRHHSHHHTRNIRTRQRQSQNRSS